MENLFQEFPWEEEKQMEARGESGGDWGEFLF